VVTATVRFSAASSSEGANLLEVACGDQEGGERGVVRDGEGHLNRGRLADAGRGWAAEADAYLARSPRSVTSAATGWWCVMPPRAAVVTTSAGAAQVRAADPDREGITAGAMTPVPVRGRTAGSVATRESTPTQTRRKRPVRLRLGPPSRWARLRVPAAL